MEINTIKISIIIPVYNSVKSLPRCIDSILSQSYKNFELIIVDDGSTDGSENICDYYKSKDQRLKVVHQNNAGVSKARNVGLELAQGEYIQFIDSDDYIEKDFLFTLNLNIDLYSSPSIIFWGFKEERNGVIIKDNKHKLRYANTPVDLIDSIISLENHYLFGWTWNKIFRRDIIMKNKILFNKDISLHEDHIFTLDYIKYIDNILILDISPYHYDTSSDNSLIKKILPYNEFKVKENLILKYRLDILSSYQKFITKKYYYNKKNDFLKSYYLSIIHQVSNVLLSTNNVDYKKNYIYLLQKDLRNISLKKMNLKLCLIFVIAHLNKDIFYKWMIISRKLSYFLRLKYSLHQ